MNYTNNLRRLGFTDDDLANGGSDRLIDGIIAGRRGRHRDAEEHFDAGADHVCIQVVTERGGVGKFPREQWRALAPALTRLRARG